MTDLSGQYLGRYYLNERLGEGGMAVVYKAYDTRLERNVAIKIIRSDNFPVNALSEVLKRFEREAKSLAKLSHPNIVKVHDYGEHDGSPFLVMEYLPGGTLKKVLGKPVRWQEAVRLILPVARGIAYAHQSGILHRDIKPANILITASGDPMLSDFGIAKLFEADQATALTGSGMAIGTPEYMAPEQWTGTTSPQSDLYSLGIVLYEMVAGRKPYVADTPAAILIKQATEPLPSPRKFSANVPEVLEKVLIKALAREPETRYKDMSAFIGALENLPANFPVVAPPPEPKQVDPTYRITNDESVESVPAELTSNELVDGKITKPGEAEEPQPSKISARKTQYPIKFSRWGAEILIGGIVVVLAIWLGLPLLEKLFSPIPVVTESSTQTMQPVVESQTLESIQAGETPTLGISPTDTSVPTVTPLPSEIKDIKGVAMVLVPKGEFTMGSTRGDPDEQPIHRVLLDSYYIDKYEVTNALYKECVNAGTCKSPTETSKYNSPRYSQHPVVYVDWNMANTYCEWRRARLPSEAEWEKSARGTDGRTYPWGEEIYVTYANYNGNIGDTTIVGDYLTGISPYGGYDMAGNVWEWVVDWYDERYYKVSPQVNPSGPDTGTYRVLRGGSWYFNFYNLRTSLRYRNIPSTTNFDIGFRCALSAGTSALQPTATQTLTPESASNNLPTQITDDKGVEMLLVSAGEFIMGNSNGQPDESPAHTVYLDSYYLDKYEITNDLYKACVNIGVCLPPLGNGTYIHARYYGNPEFNDYPVVYMTWDLAQTYCEWRGARLPTEAEWEKALRGARGDVSIDSTHGNTVNFCDRNCSLNWADQNYDDGYPDTAPKDAYPTMVSPYGFYNLSGNVWEWVQDWYSAGYYQDSLTENPTGPASGQYRVIRGGSYGDILDYTRITRRSKFDPTQTTATLGFRCAKSAP